MCTPRRRAPQASPQSELSADPHHLKVQLVPPWAAGSDASESWSATPFSRDPTPNSEQLCGVLVLLVRAGQSAPVWGHTQAPMNVPALRRGVLLYEYEYDGPV